jgi:ATP adenylyltransferase
MKYIRAGAQAHGPASPGNVSATRPLTPFTRTDPVPTHHQPCIFCDKPAEQQDEANLIVRRGEQAFVILNLYPYNNGHLMVVPYAHVASLEQLEAPTLTELMRLTQQSLAVLRAIYQPQAFNIGINIGTAAGAGIAEHVHMHIVPRWPGDTNYMTTVSGVRVIPEDLRETYRLLHQAWPTA